MKKFLLTAPLLFLLSFAGHAQCNAVQSLSASQISQLGPVMQATDTALYYEQLFQLDSLAAEARSIYASQAGIPDALENTFNLTTSTGWLSHPAAINLSRLLIAADSSAYVQVWKICKGMYPPNYLPHSVPLRAGAEICSGLLRIADAETDPVRKNAYRQWARQGFDSLLTMQLPSGAFPFPDLRTYNDPVFTAIINNYLQWLGADSVNVLVNGWIIDDSGTGEFKFDAGVIGGALAEAYRYTGDTNYLNASKRVANYLQPLHFNRNYNYNTFAAYGMIQAWISSPSDISWQQRASQTLRYSVLPGQIPNGRWMDGHNAKSVYHSIMIHNNAVVLAQLPQSDPYRDTLAQMTRLALRNYLSRMDTCGSASGFDCLLRAWWLDTTVVPQSLHDSLRDAIGRYISQANMDGHYLDAYTMGLYFDVLDTLSGITAADFVLQTNLSVFPNPVSANIQIRFTVPASCEMSVRLLDAQGREIRKLAQQQYFPGNQLLETDLSGLDNGLYFVQISGGIHPECVRLIKISE